jgi:hypothetical protein
VGTGFSSATNAKRFALDHAQTKIERDDDSEEMSSREEREMADVTYFVALPFIGTDQGVAPGSRSNASIQTLP